MRCYQLPSTIEAYAWPGGYPIVYVMNDGECMCPQCVKDNLEQIKAATESQAQDGWQIVGDDINYEDQDMYCCNCNEKIDPAYPSDPVMPQCPGECI